MAKKKSTTSKKGSKPVPERKTTRTAFSSGQVAQQLGCSRWTAWRALQESGLGIRINSGWILLESDLPKLIKWRERYEG